MEYNRRSMLSKRTNDVVIRCQNDQSRWYNLTSVFDTVCKVEITSLCYAGRGGSRMGLWGGQYDSFYAYYLRSFLTQLFAIGNIAV